MSVQVTAYRTAWNYVEVLKPKESSLIIFIGACAAIVAAGGHPSTWPFLGVLVAVALGTLGANGLTNYLDREVDARMKRTSHRSLPSKRIDAAEKVLPFTIGLMLTGLALAWLLHPLCFLFGLIGVISASLWRKRWTCVYQGAISSCAPVLVGYLAFDPHLNWTVAFLCVLIAIWLPLHVWSIMIAYRDDYLQAGVRYFPVTWETKDAMKVLPPLSILLYAVSLALWYIANFGWLFFAIANVLGLVMLYASFRLIISGASKDAWRVYKLSAFPYLGLIFLAMCLSFWV
jgi:protoheme IX farnesyltransferase